MSTRRHSLAPAFRFLEEAVLKKLTVAEALAALAVAVGAFFYYE